MGCSLAFIAPAEAAATTPTTAPVQVAATTPTTAPVQVDTTPKPGWWSNVLNGKATNDYAIANQGQLKLFTSQAMAKMKAALAAGGGAGTTLTTLVQGWQKDYTTNGYTAAKPKPSDFNGVNVGQLKYIGNIVWGQLIADGYTSSRPSWLGSTSSSDYQLAAIGQMKTVFDFEPSVPPAALSGLTGTPVSKAIDLTWSTPANNPMTKIVVQEYVTNSWKTIATLGANATSYKVTGLSSSKSYRFQVIAANAFTSSTATAVAALKPLP
jgi:hypothetical protein